MKTRWGVCNKRDNSITLNSKLIKYTLKEIDYVIVHELSHFVHFDHSRDFWNLVEENIGDSKKFRKEIWSAPCNLCYKWILHKNNRWYLSN